MIDCDRPWPKMPEEKIMSLVSEFGEFINDPDDLGEEIIFSSMYDFMRFVAYVEVFATSKVTA